MKARELTNYQWVKTACVSDEHRPVLTGVSVEGDVMAATDGHLLFTAPRSPDCGVPDGIWRDAERIEGTFPAWRQIVPEHGSEPPYGLTDYDTAVAVCRGQMAAAMAAREQSRQWGVMLPINPELDVYLDPALLLRCLRGMAVNRVRWFAASTLAPVLLRANSRTAIVMPVRMGPGEPESLSALKHRNLRTLCSITTWKET